MHETAQKVDPPTSSGQVSHSLMNVQILTYGHDSGSSRRVKLRLYAGKTSVAYWVTVPTITFHCLNRSLETVQAEVEISFREKFTYEKIKFPLGDARDEWFQLESKE